MPLITIYLQLCVHFLMVVVRIGATIYSLTSKSANLLLLFQCAPSILLIQQLLFHHKRYMQSLTMHTHFTEFFCLLCRPILLLSFEWIHHHHRHHFISTNSVTLLQFFYDLLSWIAAFLTMLTLWQSSLSHHRLPSPFCLHASQRR